MAEAEVAPSPSDGDERRRDDDDGGGGGGGGGASPQRPSAAVPAELPPRPDGESSPRRTLRLPRHRRAHAVAALASTPTSTTASVPEVLSSEVARSRAERDRSHRRWLEVSHARYLLRRARRETSRASDLLTEAKSASSRAGVVIPDDPIACDRFAVVGGPNPTVSGGATVAATGYGRVDDDAAGGAPVVLETSAGYSNTDHIVQITGDPRADRIAEMKRALRRRARAARPEHRGEERWDIRQRIPGGRRRRIVRAIDLPRAPPEPPQSGFVIFVGQMTAKVRHDRPRNAPHDQTKLVRGLGRLWRVGLSRENREYYLNFAKEAKAEYAEQVREFRATDSYRPSERFGKLLGLNHGPWVKLVWEEKNELERELATYKTIVRPLSRMTVAEAALEQQRQRAEDGGSGGGGGDEVALDFKTGRARVEK